MAESVESITGPTAKILLSEFALESASNGEVEGAGVISFVLGEGVAVFEADGADGEVDAEAEADGDLDVSIEKFIGAFGEGSGIEEDDSFDGAFEGADVFGIGDPPGGSSAGEAIRGWSHGAFIEGTEGVCAAFEIPEVDRERFEAAGGGDEAAAEVCGDGAVFSQGVVVAELPFHGEEGDGVLFLNEAQ